MKVEYCGICSSNLAPWRGAPWFTYPFPPEAPGHESVGVVDQLGAGVSGLEVGTHVSMLGNSGFAEYEIAKAKCVVPISLQLAEKMGAHLTLSLENQAKLLEAVRNATRQQLCQVVIEAGGAQETLDIASALTATRGRLVIAGYHQGGPRSVNMQGIGGESM
jgi:threonine dehydrogenase-like Zn-dependent dehydrogenase